MGYNTTGKSHRNGISGEESTKILIESGRLTSFGQSPAVIKRGGTQYKEDLLVEEKYKVSVKNRNGKSGTYDYVNTSKLDNLVGQNFEDLKNYIKSVRHSQKSKGHTKKSLEPIKLATKQKFESMAESALLSLKPKEIETLVKNNLHSYLNDPSFYFSILHKPRSALIVFPAREHPLFKFINSSNQVEYSLKFGRGKTSASVLFKDSSGQEHDFGLRLRLVTNNGMGALLAGKDVSSNPSSQLVFKLQQDNPDVYIDRIKSQHKEIVKF
jgi:hypothetical protein